jgi:protein TonB
MNKPLPSALTANIFDSAAMSRATRRSHAGLIALTLVIAAHVGAVGVMLYAPSRPADIIQVPTIQGILIPAPPAETVQLPSVKETPPPVEPLPPEPVKPKPKKVKPKPEPKPVVQPPPSEKAITQEETAVEESAPPVAEQTAIPAAEDNNALGAPVTPPHDDAYQLDNPRPAYPSLSRRLREQGVVVLEVLILASGSVGEVRIKESSGFKRLDETAIKAVRQWRYTPAKRGQQAIDYWYVQPIEFSLH